VEPVESIDYLQDVEPAPGRLGLVQMIEYGIASGFAVSGSLLTA